MKKKKLKIISIFVGLIPIVTLLFSCKIFSNPDWLSGCGNMSSYLSLSMYPFPDIFQKIQEPFDFIDGKGILPSSLISYAIYSGIISGFLFYFIVRIIKKIF